MTPINSKYLVKVDFILLGMAAKAMAKEFGIPKIKVAIVAEKAAWADPIVGIAQENLPKMGMEIVGVWRPSPTATDVTSELSAIQRSGAHIIFTTFSSSVGIPFAKQAGELKIPAPLVGINVEAQKDGFWDATGGKGNYSLTVNTYAPVKITDLTIPFLDAYKERFKETANYTAGTRDAIQILKAAIETAGTLEPDKLVPVLEKTDMKTAAGRIVFDKTHDVTWGPGFVTAVGTQWQDGKNVCVWPLRLGGRYLRRCCALQAARLGSRSLQEEVSKICGSSAGALSCICAGDPGMGSPDADLSQSANLGQSVESIYGPGHHCQWADQRQCIRAACHRFFADLRGCTGCQHRAHCALHDNSLPDLYRSPPLGVVAFCSLFWHPSSLTVVVGLVCYQLFIRPIREHESAVLIATIALAMVIQEIFLLLFGGHYLGVPPLVSGYLVLGGVKVVMQHVLALGVAVLALIATWLLLFKTKIGLGIRCTAQDREVANLMGINVNREIMMALGISVGMAAVAGAIVAPLSVIDPHMWMHPLIMMLAIVVLGGLGSIRGSFIASYILGFAEALVVFALPMGSFLKGPVALSIMILVLVIRPEGLFGVAFEEER